MPLDTGTKLGVYEILEPIGKGGMGEVYRARDSKLGREVAIKVLSDEFSNDEERLARFEREAKLLAALNHARIAHLYGFEQDADRSFLVMELVEGETLAERIARGPAPIDDALPLFIRIAEGLEAAHEKGVIHRDLKPANIKIGEDGEPKILDFGLAKALAGDDASAAESSQSPTLTKGTALGAIMGTASYMSPEQARGKTLDKRTDIWAFGCCLYEALTGKKAFYGDSVTDILAAVVRGEPELESLPRETTPQVRGLLRRCFAKDVRERIRDIGDARIALTDALDAPPSTEPPQRRTGRAVTLLFGVLALVLAASFGRYVMPARLVDGNPRLVSRSSIQLPADQRIQGYVLTPVAISPEGERVAYVALRGSERRLFVRDLDSFESNELEGTEGAEAPFFSPDGRSIGFFARRSLYRVAVAGGSPVAIADAPFGMGGSWGPNDDIIFAPTPYAGLWQVSANGGEPTQLTNPDGSEDQGYGQSWPQHLPNGRSVLFTVVGPQSSGNAVLSLETGKLNRILDGDSGAQYVHGGHVVFSRPGNSAVMAASFDLSTLAAGGTHVSILQGVQAGYAAYRFSWSASRTGSLAYVRVPQVASGLVWVDRQGQSQPLKGNVLSRPSAISLSPDGKFAAVLERPKIWVVDLERGTGTILAGKSPTEGVCQTPIWTADGSRITFSCNTSNDWDIYWAPSSGGDLEVLLSRGGQQVPHSWSAKGELFFGENGPSGSDIWVLSPDGELSPVLTTEANEAAAELSPDGRWLAYGSDETGADEIYVRSYPEGDTLRAVSEHGGVAPRWSRDGDELFYRSGVRMMVVMIETEPELTIGSPTVLFEEPYERNPWVNIDEQPAYDVAPEGDRFLMVGDRSVQQIELVLNWDMELKQLVP